MLTFIVKESDRKYFQKMLPLMFLPPVNLLPNTILTGLIRKQEVPEKKAEDDSRIARRFCNNQIEIW